MYEEPKTRPPDKMNLLDQAKTLMRQEKWAEAIALLADCQSNGEASVDELSTLAFCCSKECRFQKAAQIYEKLCELRPNHGIYNYSLAFQYKSMGKTDLAIEAYKKCISNFPQYLKAYVALGQLCEEINVSDQALNTYHDGVQAYRNMDVFRRKSLSPIFAQICTRAAKLLLSTDLKSESTLNEIEFYFRESVSAQPEDANTSYRLGSFLLDLERFDEALNYLEKAKSITPHKEYIPHKIAIAYLKKGDPQMALKTYQSIPAHKRVGYILHGMADCYLQLEEPMEAARLLYRAVQREPEKFYHHKDLGIVLAEIGDRDQALKVLEKANSLFKKEQGKDHAVILAKTQDIKRLPQRESIVLESSVTSVTSISYGVIVKYVSARGFGFIKDDGGGQDVFFNIKNVKNRVDPVEGMRVKFLKEPGRKGPQASKVWVQKAARTRS